MANLGSILFFLFCARFAHSMKIENALYTLENASAPLYSENLDGQLPNFDKAQCEKSDNEIHLNFSNVGFKRIGERFIDSRFVTCLSLGDNEITEISTEAFDRLPNLHFLDLSGNKINQNEFLAIRSVENLKTLLLDNVFPISYEKPYEEPSYDRFRQHRRGHYSNSFGSLYPQEEEGHQLLNMSLLPNLESLYLRNNRIKSFSPNLLEFTPKLTNLHLSGNNIGKFSSLFLMFDMLPPKLTHLSLDENSIRELSGQKLQHLVYINLSKNKITFLCNHYFKQSCLSLQKATRLQYLLLSRNEITDVDEDAFEDTLSLHYLDLSHNQIKSFKNGTFDPLTDLREFIVNNNLLRSVPNFSMTLNLQNITLSNNQIEIIPKGAFDNLQQLRRLLLDGNGINTIEEDAFFNLTSLEYLDLSRNQLNYLPENWILTLSNLHVLLLNENLFTDFNNLNLKNATSLTELHVENNRIIRLNTRVFSELPTNIWVYFQNQSCKIPELSSTTPRYFEEEY